MPTSCVHRSSVRATPLAGVFITTTDSARSFPRHWHGGYGLGLVDRGAQKSASGRGGVEAFAGQCITHNPGEVHDGTPIGDAGRRWRMFHIEPPAMAGLLGLGSSSGLEWQAPVIEAAALRVALGRALAAVEATAFGDGGSGGPPAAFLEESLLLAVGRTFEVNSAPRQGRPEEGKLAIVVERLTDDLKQAPTLDELALLAGTTPPAPGAPRSASARPGAQ